MKKLFAAFLLFALIIGCLGCSVQDITPAPSASSPTVSNDPSRLTVHFIDVGQADSALLEHDGQFVLIDGGYQSTGDELVDYLLDHGVEELSLVIATHLHGDHLGGLPAVLEAFPVQRIWCSSQTYYSYTYDQFCKLADQQDVPIETPRIGETVVLGDVHLKLLGPLNPPYTDLNNSSLVVMATHINNRFLFTGDMRHEAELELVEAGTDLKADVLKVGHHGSYTSTSYLFLRTVQPKHAVISCGRNNEYGHPHSAPVSRLRDADVNIFRTDKLGTILAVSDGTNISFTWEFTNAQPEWNAA